MSLSRVMITNVLPCFWATVCKTVRPMLPDRCLSCPATNNHTTSFPHSPSPSTTSPDFSIFNPASESEIYKVLSNCPNKQSDSDPIPTWLLKECSSVMVPTITNIVNLSHTSGQFHPILKESVISPLLKKSTLDKDHLSN